MRHALVITALAAALLAGCRTAYNYPDPTGPRYGGDTQAQAAAPDTLRVVSFNIAYAHQIERALTVLREEPALRGADVILLQEMDEPGTRRIAQALGLGYVYYPAVFHLRNDRDFGNAVLSRWPIVADAKLVLPHVARLQRSQRTATAATLRIGNRDVRVYSTHLGTIAEIGPGARREQLETILADAAAYHHVIIGGDMNDDDVGTVAQRAQYAWPTENGPRTTLIGRLDHIFVRGLIVPDSAAAGTVNDVRHASDHRAIWARVAFPTDPR